MTLKDYDNHNQFPPAVKHDDQLHHDKDMGNESKSHLDLELGHRIEALGDQEGGDDPVRLYLHEIGKVHLLTANDEKILAGKIEEGKRINEIKYDLQQDGRYPSATEIMLALLKELRQSASLLRPLQAELGLPATKALVESISNPELRDAIHCVIDQQLVQMISLEINASMPETEQRIIDLSLNCSLLPDIVLNAINDNASLNDIDSLVTNPAFLDAIWSHESEIRD